MTEDIHSFISSTKLFLSNIRDVRYTAQIKVNFFVGHPVHNQESCYLASNLNSHKQPSDTELSGIPLDLGEFVFSNLGDSPRSWGMAFFHLSFLQ